MTDNTEVYIQVERNDGLWTVCPAREYQRDALNDYINNNKEGKVLYEPCFDIKFWIIADKNDFYFFERENGSQSIISRNQEKLLQYVGYRNRVTI